ncbi:RHS repeat domain-containing protein [Pseudomonas inefficax]|uniref:RHS repeat domain-containing protein n=1 Tax=Pseudomonas inefficax TaxID=2078786 RepID=UPI002DBB272C|nr:RHS repeat-associated core domain-containing protein [Pseudomonas sp. CMAA1741]MEC4563052.1 RHS repeat-associated core domain-containing protein [Pseudomonas sp. CMAA1741]
MTLQSNAFNFASSTRSDVDPRTGLCGFTLEVPPLNANFLQGPELPLQLSFSPLNPANVGFGIGWAFKLSRYELNSHVLSVHTGDSFEVADQGPGKLALIHEQKFKSFTFRNIGDSDKPKFRITHTNGLVEILEPLRADRRTYLPTRVETRSGHGITLAYDDEKGRLVSITDDCQQQLLRLDFLGNHEVQLHVHPGSEAHQLFTLQFEGEELRTLVMPVSDQAHWTFNYQQFDGLRFLERLTQPYGGVERIVYKASGHQYPGLNRYLPHVIEHLRIPDPQDQTNAIKTTYAYSKENFLGYGAAGVVWDEHYNQDQLYKFTGNEFNYHTTVSHYLAGEVLKTVKHSFNRFHLLTEQVTDQAGCIQTVTTQYHDKPGNFESQDVRVQLPSKMTTTWTQTGTQLRRDEQVITVYDTDGNLVREEFANGTVMVREFYPAEGAEGCPADPDGFKRNLKSLTIYPAEDAAQAQVLRSRYTYRALPVLNASRARLQSDPWPMANTWLVADSTEEFEVLDSGEQPLRREAIAHLNMPDNVFLHGRPDYQKMQLGKTESRTEWHYEQRKDDSGKLTCLHTTATFKPHGGTLERATSSLHSALRNQLIDAQDTNGVITRYGYDTVNRMVAETVAPDQPEYTATRGYRYGRVTENQRTLWYAETTDVNKVVTRTYHDGLNRPVREERTLKALDDPQSNITRKVWETTYDSLGRVASKTQFDYLPAARGSDNSDEQVIAQTSHFSYDAWGQRCQVLQPDGVKLISQFSPFGADGNKIEQWQERPDQPGIKQQHRVTEYNRFDKPVYEYRLHLPADAEEGAKPVQVDRTDYVYDGLGRAVTETLSFAPEHNLKPRVTEYKYDHWARLFETVRADGSVLTRTFDERSTAELTTLLTVQDRSGAPARAVCKRTFDGLERLTSMAVGPRLETYQYQGQTDLMDSRTISNTDPARNDPRKHVERYQYKPALTLQPTHITATLEGTPEPHAANEAEFAFRPTSAEVVSADNANGGRAYTYTDQGYLAEEQWSVDDKEQYKIHNQHSLQGRLRYRKHSDGVACLYAYDSLGRVTTVTQGHLQARLEYNSLGLLETTTTCDTREPARFVRTTQTYDDLGREHRRTLETQDHKQVLVLKWLDGMTLQSRTLYNDSDADEDAFLRKELFEYDELNRLRAHDYLGDWDNIPKDDERWQALPCNSKGRSIYSQTFAFDALDNLERCVTRFADGSKDTARFSYAADDSFQLTEVTHTLLDDYRASQAFSYDLRGNMLNDEQGRTLEYDLRGRLERVLEGGHEQVRYRYDGHDQLLASVHGGSREVQRRYQDHSLDTTQEGNLLTQYLLEGNHALAVQRSDAPTDPLLLLTDNAGSIVTEADREGTRHASYSAYGERPDDNGMHCLLAFNGEVREEAFGWYLLGSGYRAYNPMLMRFHSPDSLAPEEAGLNPYLYALGNPVRWRDPTGHRVSPMSGDRAPHYQDDSGYGMGSALKTIIIVLSAVVLVGSIIAAPWGPPLTLQFGLAWTGVALQGVGMGLQIAGMAVEKKNPELSNKLSYAGWGATAVGVLFSGASVVRGIKKPTMSNWRRRRLHARDMRAHQRMRGAARTEGHQGVAQARHRQEMELLEFQQNSQAPAPPYEPPPAYSELPPAYSELPGANNSPVPNGPPSSANDLPSPNSSQLPSSTSTPLTSDATYTTVVASVRQSQSARSTRT